MKLLTSLKIISGALLLAACSSATGQPSRGPSGYATIGDYDIKWARGPEPLTAASDKLTPLMFLFFWAEPTGGTGVTEADWEQLALETDITVYILKKFFYVGEVYKTADGRIASCTQIAIGKGLCGRKLDLSVAQRAAMARRLIEANDDCSWVGLDTNYNTIQSYRAGAASASLHLRADCG